VLLLRSAHFTTTVTVTRVGTRMSEPTVWTKLKMGAMMGGGVGLTIGFLFGGWSILQHGAGPRGVLSTLSKTMLSSAATFSFFLAIGSVIRSDSELANEAQLRMLVPTPAIRARSEGFQLMRARWEAERRRESPSRF
ncbi:unnamed protein product, partial [Mycena citricolor]